MANNTAFSAPPKLLTAVDDVRKVVVGGVDAHRGPLVLPDPVEREPLLRVLLQEAAEEVEAGRRHRPRVHQQAQDRLLDAEERVLKWG